MALFQGNWDAHLILMNNWRGLFLCKMFPQCQFNSMGKLVKFARILAGAEDVGVVIDDLVLVD